MKLERYELKAEKSLMVFEFISEGPKGLGDSGCHGICIYRQTP